MQSHRAHLDVLHCENPNGIHSQALWHHTSVGCAILDVAGTVLDANPALLRLLGVAPAEFQQSLSLFDYCVDDQACMHHLNVVCSTAAPHVSELHFRRPDGEGIELRFETSMCPGGECHMLAVVIDVTIQRQQRAREQQIQQVQEQRRMASLQMMAGGVAHEINNALAVIMGNTELAQADLAPDHQAQVLLRSVRDAVQHAAQFIHQVLYLAGDVEVNRQPCDLNDMAVAIQALLHYSALPTPAGIAAGP